MHALKLQKQLSETSCFKQPLISKIIQLNNSTQSKKTIFPQAFMRDLYLFHRTSLRNSAGIFSNWKRYKILIIPVTLSETEALKYPPFQDIFYFDEIF